MFPRVLYTNILKNDYDVDQKSVTRLDLVEVRDCVHKLTGRECSMKIIKKNLLKLDACKALVNEIEVLRDLDHPNILKIYDTYQDATNVYIVEERFKGRELFDMLIHRNKLEEQEIM